jgi:hypothetical protein
MKLTGLLGFVGIAALLLGTSCSHKPEDFCQSWVQNTCAAITGCCTAGDSFDTEACQISLSDKCLSATAVDKIQGGELKFDYGAAGDCFGTISSCADFQSASAASTSYAKLEACANVVTGYRAAGAACTASSDCQKNGDFSTCYDGRMGASNGGICVKVVKDSATCSFSFSSLELHVCADGSFCDNSMFMANPGAPPSTQAFEYSASCQPYVGAGGSCFSATKTLPCAAGLFCSASGTAGTATCTPLKSAGATCTSPQECSAGLDCASTPGTTGQTCQTQNVGYCYAPVTVKCGDGVCTPPETAASCPQDCGGGNCVTTCAAAVTSGGGLCTGSTSASNAAYNAILSCAGALCPSECAAIASSGADSTCAGCLQTNCATQTTNCGNN